MNAPKIIITIILHYQDCHQMGTYKLTVALVLPAEAKSLQNVAAKCCKQRLTRYREWQRSVANRGKHATECSSEVLPAEVNTLYNIRISCSSCLTGLSYADINLKR